MVKVMIQIPLLHNDGTPVKEDIPKGLREILINEYGGYTKLPGIYEGGWKGDDGKTYLDSSYRYEVAVDEAKVEQIKRLIKNLGEMTEQLAMYYEIDGKPEIMEIK
jgi:hypothetical protein